VNRLRIVRTPCYVILVAHRAAGPRLGLRGRRTLVPFEAELAHQFRAALV
jgi:hypothetical protein